MAINSKYNGWSAAIRKFRGNKFYRLLHAGQIPKPKKCDACGVENMPCTYHAEEYGPTWEEYVEGAKAVCAYCHGMIHMRFKYPNRWNRFRHRIWQGHEFFRFYNMGDFFTAINSLPDLPEYAKLDSGVEWLDALSTSSYKGEDKVATVCNADGSTSPDPAIYTQKEISAMEKSK